MHAVCINSDKYREAAEELDEAMGYLKHAYAPRLHGYQGDNMRTVLDLLYASGGVQGSAFNCVCTLDKDAYAADEAHGAEYLNRMYESGKSAALRMENATVAICARDPGRIEAG